MTVTITTHSPAQTQALAERLAKLLRPGDVLAYTGPMGAGKTTFTVGLARGLGSSDWVSSPTFALVQEYRGPVPLCHFDFYRITGVDCGAAAVWAVWSAPEFLPCSPPKS